MPKGPVGVKTSEIDCRSRQDPAYRLTKERAPHGAFSMGKALEMSVFSQALCELRTKNSEFFERLLIFSNLLLNLHLKIVETGGPNSDPGPWGESSASAM